ncbi:MAG: hypothetical protein ABFS23_08575 [Pseudomonadota bacterium]
MKSRNFSFGHPLDDAMHVAQHLLPKRFNTRLGTKPWSPGRWRWNSLWWLRLMQHWGQVAIYLFLSGFFPNSPLADRCVLRNTCNT